MPLKLHCDDLKNAIKVLKKSSGLSMLEILVNKGARDNLGRPKTSPIENKINFVENLKH